MAINDTSIAMDTQEQGYTFADIVDTYSNGIYKFCRSLTYSKEDAEDLFQETFLQALEQMPKIRTFKNPQSFLFSTTLYIWKSWKRKYARRNRLAPTQPLDETIPYGISIEDSFMAKEDIRIIRKQVDALPEKYRVPILLYYSVEMGIDGIAGTLDIPTGTVKSRLYKARKLIEKGLVKIGY